MNSIKYGRGATLFASLALVAACSQPQPGAEFNDPYEGFNRQVHAVNKGLDRTLLRPASRVVTAAPHGNYDWAVNFSDNLSLPGMVVNGALQGDVEGMARNSMRFIINSTIGVFGLADFAGDMGLYEKKTDFGHTLAVWGVPEGAYLELPLIGPSTERDAVGEVVDMFLDPLDHVSEPVQLTWGTEAQVGEIIVERGIYSSTIDSVLQDSADSYAQSRLAYLQNRRYEVGETADDGGIDPYAIDPYGIDPYEELQQ
ncbi:VacJ family lipoprotein [Pelagovum pacificum]|uniref:VacJ family lipoprotein n=1 Tax=Pelagovum pacificum TaxID=2588711 RepID=A0A5C5GHS0_9RHOB|nr:VacJ family lipoprotein [Pelagovum pacificum]QQA42606.1 VacJ family lipoprotein [Pelagovum pacificum]TNY34243.1 VacJ family lipoprotein [Pelagovum pacificum]